jgi:hypothetical protein
VKPLMHLLLSLPRYYLRKFRIDYCLALLRSVAIGELSPEIVGGYRYVLVMGWMISWK